MESTHNGSELAREGRPIAASNATVGRDPAANHVKELRVDYTLDGKPGHVVAPENCTLALPLAMTTGQAPTWETSVTTGGAPVGIGRGKGQAGL